MRSCEAWSALEGILKDLDSSDSSMRSSTNVVSRRQLLADECSVSMLTEQFMTSTENLCYLGTSNHDVDDILGDLVSHICTQDLGESGIAIISESAQVQPPSQHLFLENLSERRSSEALAAIMESHQSEPHNLPTIGKPEKYCEISNEMEEAVTNCLHQLLVQLDKDTSMAEAVPMEGQQCAMDSTANRSSSFFDARYLYRPPLGGLLVHATGYLSTTGSHSASSYEHLLFDRNSSDESWIIALLHENIDIVCEEVERNFDLPKCENEQIEQTLLSSCFAAPDMSYSRPPKCIEKRGLRVQSTQLCAGKLRSGSMRSHPRAILALKTQSPQTMQPLRDFFPTNETVGDSELHKRPFVLSQNNKRPHLPHEQSSDDLPSCNAVIDQATRGLNMGVGSFAGDLIDCELPSTEAGMSIDVVNPQEARQHKRVRLNQEILKLKSPYKRPSVVPKPPLSSDLISHNEKALHGDSETQKLEAELSSHDSEQIKFLKRPFKKHVLVPKNVTSALQFRQTPSLNTPEKRSIEQLLELDQKVASPSRSDDATVSQETCFDTSGDEGERPLRNMSETEKSKNFRRPFQKLSINSPTVGSPSPLPLSHTYDQPVFGAATNLPLSNDDDPPKISTRKKIKHNVPIMVLAPATQRPCPGSDQESNEIAPSTSRSHQGSDQHMKVGSVRARGSFRLPISSDQRSLTETPQSLVRESSTSFETGTWQTAAGQKLDIAHDPALAAEWNTEPAPSVVSSDLLHQSSSSDAALASSPLPAVTRRAKTKLNDTTRDPEERQLMNRKLVLQSQLASLQEDVKAIESAQTVEERNEADKLDRLIDKWRSVAQQACEEVFASVSRRIEEVGGVRVWSRSIQPQQWFDSEEAEAAARKAQEEAEYDLTSEEKVAMGIEADCFSMEMMLTQLGIPMSRVAWDADLCRWKSG